MPRLGGDLAVDNRAMQPAGCRMGPKVNRARHTRATGDVRVQGPALLQVVRLNSEHLQG